MGKPIVAALEVGTTHTLMLVGDVREGGRVHVTGWGCVRTAGVRKGLVIELKQAQAGVHTALRQAEDTADANIGEVLLAVSGAHIATSPGEGRLPVRGGDGKVTRDDIDEVRDLARENRPGDDRFVLHVVPQLYRLDDLDGIPNPEGMRGKQLRLSTLSVHGQRNRIDDAVNMLKGLAIDTRDVAFSPLAAAAAVLTPEQRNHGVLLIDLGGGTTNFALFARNVLTAAGSLGVGGDHITNDIAQAFGLPLNQAEEIKLSDGCAVIDPQRSSRRLELPASVVAAAPRTISVKALHTVMEARVRETLELVRDQLGVELRQCAGAVFTGGGAYLPHLDELAASVFGMRATLGEPLPNLIEGWPRDKIRPAMLATTAGLLIGSAQTQHEDNLGSVGSLVGKLGKVFRR